MNVIAKRIFFFLIISGIVLLVSIKTTDYLLDIQPTLSGNPSAEQQTLREELLETNTPQHILQDDTGKTHFLFSDGTWQSTPSPRSDHQGNPMLTTEDEQRLSSLDKVHRPQWMLWAKEGLTRAELNKLFDALIVSVVLGLSFGATFGFMVVFSNNIIGTFYKH